MNSDIIADVLETFYKREATKLKEEARKRFFTEGNEDK
jgi:hypothetical protein